MTHICTLFARCRLLIETFCEVFPVDVGDCLLSNFAVVSVYAGDNVMYTRETTLSLVVSNCKIFIK